MYPRFLTAVLALTTLSVAQAELPCQCTFTNPPDCVQPGDDVPWNVVAEECRDPPDCVTYGQLGDGNLIPWNVAPQECLDVFNIKDEAIDPESLAMWFPNPDGTGGNVNVFVSYLRFGEGSVPQGIKASFPQFWVEDENQPGKMVLKDEVETGAGDGTTVSCNPDNGGSESDCYGQIALYFNGDPGASEFEDIGKALHKQAAVSREKEQSLVRIRLCSDGPTAECGALSDQVQRVIKENEGKFCSAYGLGPAGQEYTICGEEGTGGKEIGGTDTKMDGEETSGAPYRLITYSWLLGRAWAAFAVLVL